MRKAFLGIALIAASFAGGAAANGPGLSWAQSLLAELRTPGSAEEDAAAAAAEIAAAEGFPEAPLRALAEPDADEGEVEVEVPPSDPATVTAAIAPTPPAQAPVAPTPTAAPAEVPAPPAPVSAPLPKLSPTPSVASPTPSVAWSDAPDSAAPAAAVVPGQATPAPSPAPAPAPVATEAAASASAPMADPAVSTAALPAASPDPTAWAETCRRMRDLGITKYWVEGEPSGAVRFRCLVPIAGEGAVAQQFEAEGDAVADAAEAALRRVALWRAAAAVSEGS